ncbi:hypothetical protein FOA52_013603 [Chlamydomonas sp. UWO 241]|nr:hypothetical protein FOA52_013603 [Chlamydomonas sp. UWO 241]
MAGGVGITGRREVGVIPRVIQQVFSLIDQIKKKAKSGENVIVHASALELYNEDLFDLSLSTGGGRGADDLKGWDGRKPQSAVQLKLQERPGNDGRVVPEVLGIHEYECRTHEELQQFFDDCMLNRSTTSTRLNDRSSRSHAIFTLTVSRTMVDVAVQEKGAKVRTTEFTSKLHLVDLAGSERVKRSGAVGKELKEASHINSGLAFGNELKEASHINSGLLALGNVISALSESERAASRGKQGSHVPYRDSKLTRLLQDSLGGNSLTVLISCISPSEMDFEETNNTLKYANRACSIKNTALPAKFTMLEEDLLPALPAAGANGIGMVQLQALLNDHAVLKDMREKHRAERIAREERHKKELVQLKLDAIKKKGYARLRGGQYEALRRALAARRGDANIGHERIEDDALVSFGPRKEWMAHQAASATELRPRRGIVADIHGTGSDSDDDFEFEDIDENAPRLLARFRVNRTDVLSVFKAVTEEDYTDVMSLLPQGTSLPASDKMTYLLARLEVHKNLDIDKAVQKVVDGKATMRSAVGPTVGCLMATLGTNMISSCIFEFNDPEELTYYPVDERIELWGLQIPHNTFRPSIDAGQGGGEVTWTSIDRLNMSIGLLFALCNHAIDEGFSCGLHTGRAHDSCAGVRMREVSGHLKLVYPPSAHDFEYYRASTVAFFVVNEVKEGLRQVLPVV